MTGGRLKRVKGYLQNEEYFFLTYGDGLSDININASLDFHKTHGKLATVTAVQPPGRFGVLSLMGNQVTGFSEKPKGKEALINGGFFVLEPEVAEYVLADSEPFESGALPKLVEEKELMAYHHEEFWQPMDTHQEFTLLNQLWASGNAPWLA